MTRIIFTFLFLSFACVYFTQTDYSKKFLDSNLKKYCDKRKSKKTKSFKAYYYESEDSKRGVVVHSANYNRNGQILNEINYTSYNNSGDDKNLKDFEESSYTFDDSGNLLEIKSTAYSGKKIRHYTRVSFKNDSMVNYLTRRWGEPGSVNIDSFFYKYDASGQLHFIREIIFNDSAKKYDPPQIWYFHYNQYSEAYTDKKERDTLVNNGIRNVNGCLIGNKDTIDERITNICDSLCRVLESKTEKRINGKWIVYLTTQNKYKGDHKTEETWMDCTEEYYDNCTGILKQTFHGIFEYDNIGNYWIKRYDEHGKIINILKYVDEIYND